MPSLDPLFAASVPSWVWATLLMALFVAVSIGTMWLVRYPVRRPPPSDRRRRKTGKDS
jgi:hypothetical protein